MLAERRRALDAAQRGPLVWLGGLTLTVGVIWPFLAPTVPSLSAKPALAYGPAVPLLVVAVVSLVVVRERWKRELMQPLLSGYRQVLGVARAHGVPLTHVPAWLEGRGSGGGKGAAPIPTYEKVAPIATYEDVNPQPASIPVGPLSPVGPVAIPPKPASVTAYEEIADAGGWHDETGCLLIFAGAGGAIWAATSDAPIGYGAPVLIPVAILTWLAGSRQGKEKSELRAEALTYVRALAAAQAAGAQLPELSPVLKRLLEESEAGRS
ncbi:hypothetical protein [Streptomyces sp. NPDC001530]|uniref:hypothetical protein n=1 Tax=Streptomyces sp. NPDC001530 TaxID=3364582 RepID=UPI0036B123CC